MLHTEIRPQYKMDQTGNLDFLIEKLCMIYASKVTEHSTSSFHVKPLFVDVENKLKTTAHAILKNHRNKQVNEDYPFHLLHNVGLSTQSAAVALAARLRMKYRRFDNADFIETNVKKLLQDSKNAGIVRLLICLSQVDKTPITHNFTQCSSITRERLHELTSRKARVVYGDYNCSFPTAEYKLYPSWAFDPGECEESFMFPIENTHEKQTQNVYADVKIQVKNFSADDCGSIFGMHSWLFKHDVPIQEYERQYKTLYGGLSHSETTSIDIRLTLPDLDQPFDIIKEISSRKSFSEKLDEGIFSRPSSCVSTPEQISKLQPLNHDDHALVPVKHWSKLFEDDQPYEGYRCPDYDLLVWDECLKVERSTHLTWETLGQPAGSTCARFYLFDCDRFVTDDLSFHHRLVVHDFAKFLNRNNTGVVIMEPKRIYIGEALLFKHCLSVVLATNSESFVFYKFGQMFLPMKDLYFSGIDPGSLNNLLRGFAEMGTCFYRLQAFARIADSEKGAVFTAFCHAIQRYLDLYRQHIIEIAQQLSFGHSLLSLDNRLQNIANQLTYVCMLCKCGSPDIPSEGGSKGFPLGVPLLSYLFNEAVLCHDRNLYLILVSLLADACQPYLQFVKEWLFRGRSMKSDLNLEINDKFASNRDRSYWTQYIREPACVPTFLQFLHSDMYVCGKTVALMNLINPQHFLVLEGFECPDIQVTFSRSNLLIQEELWLDHEVKMNICEDSFMLSWLQVEEDAYNLRHKAARNARILGEEHLQKQKDILQENEKIVDRAKRKEFSRLKEEAERALLRRKQEKIDARKEDHFPAYNRHEVEEAKKELIKHYQNLERDADKRIAFAKWRNKRHLLQDKRLKHFAQEHLDISTEVKESSGIIPHLQDESSTARAISQITDESLPHAEYDLRDGHRRKATDKNILDSSIGDFFKDKLQGATSDLNQIQLFNLHNQGHGSHHSHSTVQDIIYYQTDDVDGADSESLTRPKISHSATGISTQSDVHKSTVQDLLYNQNKPLANEVLPDKLASIEDFLLTLPKDILQEEERIADEAKRKEFSSLKEEAELALLRRKHETIDARKEEDFPVYNGHEVEEADKEMIKQRKLERDADKRIAFAKWRNQRHLLQDKRLKHFAEEHKSSTARAISQINDESLPHAEYDLRDGHRRKATDKNILDSSIGDLFKNKLQGATLDFNQIQLFNLHNQGHGRHHSHSTVQDIMYYQTDGADSESPTRPHFATGRRLTQSEVHKSTVQHLLYNQNKPVANEVLPDKLASIEDFRLTLPDYNHWETKTMENMQGFEEDGFNENRMKQDHTNDLDILDLRPLALLLRQSVVKPIQAQVALANKCIVNYFMVDLKLMSHFEMIQHFLFLEDGLFADSFCTQLFEKVHSSNVLHSILHPVTLNQLLSRAINSSIHARSPLVKKLSAGLKIKTTIHADNDPKVLSCLSLYYDVGWPCNIVITSDHMEHYNRILSFFIQMKHAVWALHDVTSKLIYIERNIAKYDISDGELRLMHIYRYEMQLFVKVMQGYMSTGVVHVCWDEFQRSLKHVHCLDDIHSSHSTYINKCLFRCLLTEKTSAVMNVITDIIKSILSFRSKLCVGNISFNNVQRAYHSFVKYSNFLLLVVSKLVDRGYQPHLEDFLTRLNFNGYYNK